MAVITHNTITNHNYVLKGLIPTSDNPKIAVGKNQYLVRRQWEQITITWIQYKDMSQEYFGKRVSLQIFVGIMQNVFKCKPVYILTSLLIRAEPDRNPVANISPVRATEKQALLNRH